MNKQRIYIASLLLLCGLYLASCSKFVTYDDPQATSDEQWWRTETDARAALATVYASVPLAAWNTTTVAKNNMMLTGITDDGVSRQDARGAYAQFALGVQNSTWNVGEHVWIVNYRDIRRANHFLANIDRPFFNDEGIRERFRLEARALRAFYHMELLMYFGGVPIVTEVIPANDNQRKRNTEEEVYNFVISELKACAENESMPEFSLVVDDEYRITKGVCWALISRLALYFKKYEEAKEAALKVIQLNRYELHSSYSTLFTYAAELNKERIFIRNNGAADAWRNFAPASRAGEPVIFPTAALVNSYETRQGKIIAELSADSIAYYQKNPSFNRDPRFGATILVPEQNFEGTILRPFTMASGNPDRIGANYSTATGFWLRKYLDARDQQGGGSGNRTLDFMIIRYAEVLLNYVEALVELNDWQNPDVVKYVNAIRVRAGMRPVDDAAYEGRFTASQEEMRQFIRRERRVELAFEGLRYFDIRRWGVANTVMNGPVYGAVNPNTGTPEPVETRSYNPNRD
ncbi:MAG: RagB/SusD family nutrient uptake outer membrane protein, partial [Niabella sp.]